MWLTIRPVCTTHCTHTEAQTKRRMQHYLQQTHCSLTNLLSKQGRSPEHHLINNRNCSYGNSTLFFIILSFRTLSVLNVDWDAEEQNWLSTTDRKDLKPNCWQSRALKSTRTINKLKTITLTIMKKKTIDLHVGLEITGNFVSEHVGLVNKY